MNAFKILPFLVPRLLATVRASFASTSSCSVSNDGKKIRLLCDGEPERRYHGSWLRHNCRCPDCFLSSVKQNIVHHSNLMGLKITDATIESDDTVLVNWSSEVGSHSCSFDINWLKQHDYTTPQAHHNRMEDQRPLVAESLPFFDYKDVMGSQEGYYEWMKQINYYGMSLLQNVPPVDMEMVRVTDRIAPPQLHAYKTVFDVKAVAAATDAAYTTSELLLHTDQNFLETAPGIQIMLCLIFDDCVEGGESIIVDTYPVLEELREKYPNQFDTLTRVPYITHREHVLEDEKLSAGFKHSEPHVGLDIYGRICSFNWCPQHHLPLAVSENETEEYYDAFTLLSEMLEKSPLKFTHRLKVGEAIVVNNRRVLHSRNSFKLNGGSRYLQGHYINSDFFRSRMRTLAGQLNKTDPIKTMFNRSHAA